MRTKTTMITNKKLGRRKLRKCHTKNQSEDIGALRSAKTNHQEKLSRKGQRNSQKNQRSGQKGALKNEQHNHEKETGKKSFKKAKEKVTKGRI